MAFLIIGAGSIRAYPHSESTGLVISDTAKIQTFFHLASVFHKKTAQSTSSEARHLKSIGKPFYSQFPSRISTSKNTKETKTFVFFAYFNVPLPDKPLI